MCNYKDTMTEYIFNLVEEYVVLLINAIVNTSMVESGHPFRFKQGNFTPLLNKPIEIKRFSKWLIRPFLSNNLEKMVLSRLENVVGSHRLHYMYSTQNDMICIAKTLDN